MATAMLAAGAAELAAGRRAVLAAGKVQLEEDE
jgi:hypothetical protein